MKQISRRVQFVSPLIRRHIGKAILGRRVTVRVAPMAQERLRGDDGADRVMGSMMVQGYLRHKNILDFNMLMVMLGSGGNPTRSTAATRCSSYAETLPRDCQVSAKRLRAAPSPARPEAPVLVSRTRNAAAITRTTTPDRISTARALSPTYPRH